MATTAERLAEALDARHRLAKGELEAEIRTADGETVKYAAVNAADLDAYIAQLQAQSGTRRRSVRLFF
jgi:hypothetical protein